MNMENFFSKKKENFRPKCINTHFAFHRSLSHTHRTQNSSSSFMLMILTCVTPINFLCCVVLLVLVLPYQKRYISSHSLHTRTRFPFKMDFTSLGALCLCSTCSLFLCCPSIHITHHHSLDSICEIVATSRKPNNWTIWWPKLFLHSFLFFLIHSLPPTHITWTFFELQTRRHFDRGRIMCVKWNGGKESSSEN